MEELADVVVIESLPLAACPAHAVLPARWTLSSGFRVLQAAPQTPKNLQGLSVSEAKSPLHEAVISTGDGAAIHFDQITQKVTNVWGKLKKDKYALKWIKAFLLTYWQQLN